MISIITHDPQRSRRLADRTAFLCLDTEQGGRAGYLDEHGVTAALFETSEEHLTRRSQRGTFG